MNKILLDLLSLGAILSSVLVITSKNPVIAVIFLISLFINTAGYLLIMGITFVGITYIIVYIGAITVLFLFIIMMINIRLLDLLEFGKEYTKNFPLAIFIGTLFVYEIINVLPFMFNNVFAGNLNYPLDLLNQLNAIFVNKLLTNDFNNISNLLLQPSITSQYMAYTHESIAWLDLNILYSNNFVDTLWNDTNPSIKLNHFLQIEILGQSLYTYGAIWLLLSSFILLLSMISALFLSNV